METLLQLIGRAALIAGHRRNGLGCPSRRDCEKTSRCKPWSFCRLTGRAPSVGTKFWTTSRQKNTVIASWRGTAGGHRAIDHGNDVVRCPLSHCYLDCQETDAPGQTLGAPYAAPLTLERYYSFEPAEPGLDAKAASQILRLQGNIWTEYMWSSQDAEAMAFPRACALAEVGWSRREGRNFDKFLARPSALFAA